MRIPNTVENGIKIGVSLPPDYLAGRQSGIYRESLGHPAEFLERLKQHGVDSVELRSLHSVAAPEKAVEAAMRIEDAGMNCTAHGSLPSSDEAAVLDASVKALSEELHLASPEKPLLITIHARRSKNSSTAEMAGQTEKTLTFLIKQAESEGLTLQWAIELTRCKGAQDPGAMPRTLLELVEQIDRPDVGICLDIGHCHSNVLRGFHNFSFKDAFLKRVVHVHAHDIGPRGQTHFPLTCGNLPLNEYGLLLVRNGYGGIMNLELSPARFAGFFDLQEAFFESVRTLKSLESPRQP